MSATRRAARGGSRTTSLATGPRRPIRWDAPRCSNTTRSDAKRAARSREGSRSRARHDLAGNLTSQTDFGGAVITFQDHAAGRLTRRTLPGGSSAVFTYTPSGRRATALDARGVTTYSYDSRDRQTHVVQPDGSSLDYAYDPASNLRTRLTGTVGGATFAHAYTYDRANQPLTVIDSLARTFTFAYTPTGQTSSLAYPNGVTSQDAYNALSRLTGVTTRNAGGVDVRSFSYALGPAGHRPQIGELGGVTRSYAYDAAGRLTQESVNGPGGLVFTDAFTYDAAGNRTQVARTPAAGAVETRLFTYDTRDRLLTDGSVTFTWDADGRLLTKSGSTGLVNVWDAEGRLRISMGADGTSVSHDYDVDGNRVRTNTTHTGGALVTTRYLVDTNGPLSHVVAESNDIGGDADGGVRARERPASRRHPSDWEPLLSRRRPRIGSIANGHFRRGHGYCTIRCLRQSHGANRFGSEPRSFAGEPVGAVGGVYQLRARWMDPSAGRFLSQDPLDGTLEQPRTLHRYVYAGNDPVNATDPTGEFEFSIAGLSVSINIQGNLRSIQGGVGQATLQRVRQQLARFSVDAVKALQKVRQAGQQTHHLIEQRLWRANPTLQRILKSVDDMPGVNLTAAEHQVYTNLWRQVFAGTRTRPATSRGRHSNMSSRQPRMSTRMRRIC